jgi:hypothetical protein
LGELLGELVDGLGVLAVALDEDECATANEDVERRFVFAVRV